MLRKMCIRDSYGKYRFRYDPVCDEYICQEKQRLTRKTTTREGYRQYCCEGKTCKGCPRRAECFGASMSRKVVERHVWQDALERVIHRIPFGYFVIRRNRRKSGIDRRTGKGGAAA